ncbi:MAG: nitroreductase [Myxococcales bacterium]|nr:nitroreductase [Myxococcales bacterium]
MVGRNLAENEIALIDEVIRERRSLSPSSLSDRLVERETVEAILEAGNWAPSHYVTEPWRFVVFEGEARQRLADVFLKAVLEERPDASDRVREKVHGKPLRSQTLIAVIRQGGLHPKAKDFEDEWAVACAVQNMAIAAAARGLGLFWSTGTPMAHPYVAEHLNCDADARVMGFLYIGWPGHSDWPTGRRGDVSEKTEWRG